VSARIARGYHIVVKIGGEILPNVFTFEKVKAVEAAEAQLGKKWDELTADGWALCEGEFWSYP
jgi:hypothetical protein